MPALYWYLRNWYYCKVAIEDLGIEAASDTQLYSDTQATEATTMFLTLRILSFLCTHSMFDHTARVILSWFSTITLGIQWTRHASTSTYSYLPTVGAMRTVWLCGLTLRSPQLCLRFDSFFQKKVSSCYDFSFYSWTIHSSTTWSFTCAAAFTISFVCDSYLYY